jgi:transposase
MGLRHARYLGVAKVQLQHLATAVALNLVRLDNWLAGVPWATTRSSRFARLGLAS